MNDEYLQTMRDLVAEWREKPSTVMPPDYYITGLMQAVEDYAAENHRLRDALAARGAPPTQGA